MNYTTNYNLNKPERNEQFNLDHWNENSDAIDTAMNANKVNIATNKSSIDTILTGLSTKNVSDTSSVYYKLMKLIYPVGSIYWSSNSTNPATLFGGTWAQIKDRFVLACGDTYSTTGATGGNANITLTEAQMPSHTHSFTPSGTIESTFKGSAHSHSFTPSGTISENGQHSHGITTYWKSGATKGVEGYYAKDYANHFNTEEAGNHSHTFTGTQGTTGAATQGGTVSSTFKGTGSETAKTGGGAPFSIMPPYVVKYCWERTA